MVVMVAWNCQNFAEDSNVPRQQQALITCAQLLSPCNSAENGQQAKVDAWRPNGGVVLFGVLAVHQSTSL